MKRTLTPLMTGSAAFRVLSRFVETMLTMIETCRQQRRNAFAFITAAVEARLAHKPAPFIAFRVVNGYHLP